MADVATLAASVLPKKVMQPKKKARTDEKKEMPKKIVSKPTEETEEQTEASKSTTSKYKSPLIRIYEQNWLNENQLQKKLMFIQSNPVQTNGALDMNNFEVVVDFSECKPYNMIVRHGDVEKVVKKIRELSRRYSSGKPEDMMDNMEHQMYEHENVEQVPSTSAPVRKASTAPKKAPRKRKMKDQELEQSETVTDQFTEDIERQIDDVMQAPDSDRSDDESELA